MKLIRCLILEDEPLAQEVIENYIGRLPFLTLVAKCDNALDAYGQLSNNSIDLLFCDIQMPRITGIEFLRSLSHKPHVVMTTAYNEYALEGFDLDVADYLLKPISFDRFLRAVQKVKERIDGKEALQQQNKPQQPEAVIPVAAAVPVKEDYMFIKENNNLVKVKYASIQYVEGMKDYIKVYLNDRMIVTYMTLKKMEEALSDNFLRIHKSYIVNLNAIASIEGNMIRLEKKTELPIGLQSRAEVMEIINRKVLTK